MQPNATDDIARPVPRSTMGLASIFQRDRLAMLRDWAAEFDGTGLSSFRYFKRTIVLINDPDLVTEVLVARDEDFHKGPALSIYSRPLLGNGLLTSEDEFHRRQRRLSAPAFAHKRVAGYADFMAAAAQRLQAGWQDGAVIDIGAEMMRLTLGIVGKTLFDAEEVADDADSVGHWLTVLLNYFTDVVRSPVRLPFSYIPFWRSDVHHALDALDRMIYRLIEERRRSERDVGDLLSMLLLSRGDDGEAMDDAQIRDELMTLFLAGHETTANALTWTWYMLAKHPDIARRVCAEVRGALRGRIPTFEDLAHMPITLRVFKEAVRLYPPAYVLARQAVRSTTIGGYSIPHRTIVLISPYLLHRLTRNFANPDEFDPDRWADANFEKTLPRHAYLPFGGGPRICIGASFALMEGHLALAAVASHVDFALTSDTPVETDPLIVLRPKGRILLRVRRETERLDPESASADRSNERVT